LAHMPPRKFVTVYLRFMPQVPEVTRSIIKFVSDSNLIYHNFMIMYIFVHVLCSLPGIELKFHSCGYAAIDLISFIAGHHLSLTGAFWHTTARAMYTCPPLYPWIVICSSMIRLHWTVQMLAYHPYFPQQ